MSPPADERGMQVLVAVAEEGSIARAAARLGRPIKAVTKDLDRIEASVGVPLTARNHHGAALTSAGRAALSGTRTALEVIDQTRAAAYRAARDASILIRVGHAGVGSWRLLPAALGAVCSRRPEVRVELVEMPVAPALAALGAGTLDVVIGSVRVADLDRVPLVSYPPAGDLDAHRMYVSMCRDGGFEPSIVHTAETLGSRLALVAAGCGVALSPVDALEFHRHPRVVWRPLDPAVDATVPVVVRSDEQRSLVAQIIDQLGTT